MGLNKTAKEASAAGAGVAMYDETVFVGYHGGHSLYTTASDEGATFNFNEAGRHAANLNAAHYLGHDDWRVPDRAELDFLRESRDQGSLKGTFNDGFHWSSTPDFQGGGWAQRFGDGFRGDCYRSMAASVRLVRG